jgi:Protein phosphatase 2C
MTMTNACPSLVCKAFAVPKAGHRREEYEDAFAADPETGRFAVADGAAESAFAATWANLLVGHYVQQPGPWSQWLPVARQRWQQQCARADMPWYLEEKFEQGAFATFLGVSFRGPDRWRAGAVGDCCLFQVRGSQLRQAFPVGHSATFGNQPALLCSRSTAAGGKVKRVRLEADWCAGDRMLLITDALAQWFLRNVEENRKPWHDLLGMRSQEQFAVRVQALRDAKEIRNDDATLVVIDSVLH